ncbi:hypothetical protein BLS_000086 [Venturia inaequalis]|uniref:ArfGap-domain-containing protein n=1 Tax=Venturia inaequalis TaxID=5025 RepID=A0A8H3Z428_VENIN|nr:hypothetical protein BLS_000086 [Venturia inaequalis]
MATINKRQQVRNERGLQELIKTVPGNDRCADCATKNPGWASWSLGIFLCIRCAALHRKLGTHISKVKSLSMDSWSNDQVESMKRIGNVNSNHTYNPRNTKPSIPIDADEIEGVMERFIRQKYEHRAFAVESAPGSRQNTGSTSSDDRPPPLPPKPSKRFHFPSLRAASSTFPIRSSPLSPPTSPGLSGFGREPSPPPKDKKPAKFLGAEVGGSRDDGFETKMAYLREMGFPDDRRNMQVLRGLDGNVERSVETLVRLGEASKSSSRTHSPLPPSPLADVGFTTGFTNGITVDKTRITPRADKSNNPFDINVHKSLPPPPAQGQTGARGAFMERTVSPLVSSNPFLQSGQQTQQTALDQSFQNMQISQLQQQHQQPQILQDQSFPNLQNSQQFQQSQQQAANPQLFPNTTGGYNASQPQTNPFLQTYTPPPMPQSQQHVTYQEPQALQHSNTMPFLPFAAPASAHPQQQQSSFNPPQQQQHQAAYLPPRQDKNSILALYNYPQAYPPPASMNAAHDSGQVQAPTTINGQRRSVTMPVSSMPSRGNINPFALNGTTHGSLGGVGNVNGMDGMSTGLSAAPTNGYRHVSNESVQFGADMMMNGRHSPDAFAGLSARLR